MTTQATGVWLDEREERQVTTQATGVWLDEREERQVTTQVYGWIGGRKDR